MVIIGVDVGTSGALAIINTDTSSEVVSVCDMPTLVTEGTGRTKKGNVKKHKVIDEQKLRKLLIQANHVFIEKAQSMPGQGVSSMFSYGTGYGIIRGICVGLQIPYTLVHPASWKRVMLKDMDKEKSSSIVRCLQLFPTSDVSNHGQADALLIALYGMRELGIEMGKGKNKKKRLSTG